MAEPRRDDFPNHFVGDLVHTERGLGGRATNMLPRRPRLPRRRLVSQFRVVYLQWAAHGVAMPLRRSPLRAATRPHCRIRDRGPVSMWEDEQERTPDS